MNLVAALTSCGVGTCGADDNQAQAGHLVAAPLRGNHYGDHAAAESHLIAHTLRAEGADASEDGTGRGVPMVMARLDTHLGGEVTCSIDANYGKGTGGRGAAERPVVATGMAVRRLTPTECERLMGLPDHWTAHDADGNPISDSARYRMLGNSVAVPCVEWIGRRILEALRE